MRTINKILDYSLFVIMLTMALVMASNVFCRYCLHFAISWADELCQSLLVWLTFLGSALALREGQHYCINFLEQKLDGKVRIYFSLFYQTVTLVAVILLLIWSTKITIGITSWIMPAMRINRAWVYGACPVGCVFMLMYGVIEIVKNIKMLKK